MLFDENISYLTDLCNQLEKNDKIETQNFTEKMMNYLKENKFNHMALYHDEKKTAHKTMSK